MDLENTIRKYALHNAVLHKGKANQGAVIGKVVGEHPESKSDLKALAMQVGSILKEVNGFSPADQLKELQKLAPELLEKKEKEERDIFAFLNLEKKAYSTVFPTGPEKYPHLGHAKSAYINYLLSKKTGGKYFIRYDDTNPKLVEEKFYGIIKKDLEWVGIQFDGVVHASDFMDLYYEKAELLIKNGHAYVDTASADDIRKSRETGEATPARKSSAEENMSAWEKMKQMDEGSVVLRLKIDLKHQNTTMRDPNIFRIIDAEHPRTKEKYRVWPTYDIQTAIMDSYSNIEFRLRSKEFEMRAELQRWIQEKCEMRQTKTYEFARFNMEGVKSSGRIIREGIEKGELLGWDDPSLTTIAALRRRGFQPEAIRNFCLNTGISKSEATLTWDDIIIQNKRILDSEAPRYFMVHDAVEITIENAEDMSVELPVHPDNKEAGVRTFNLSSTFLIEKEDFDKMEDGKVYRLIDAFNIEKKADSFSFHSKDYDSYKESGHMIIHFLPKQDDLVQAEILMPDKKVVTGVCESATMNVDEGGVIQFQRFGFCRLDKKEDNKLKFWFTHN